MKGLFGKFLEVNLSDGEIGDYSIPEDWMKKHLGGRGIGVRILIEELKGGEDPLGPENLLVFATGPLQGTNAPGSGRHVVLAKSPKTGSVSDSYAGGYFGHELGRSGYDGIIVRGKADGPRYISLIGGEARIHDAKDLWGLEVAETEAKLRDEHDGGRVTSIGPGGEKLVRFACVMNDRNRAAGRPGFGAVMGSKKLKAILVRGGSEKPIHDESKLDEAKAKFAEELMDSPVRDWGKYGSSGAVTGLNEMGVLPTKNFQEGVFRDAEKISGQKMYDEILVRRDSCPGCPVRCKRVVKTEFSGEKVQEKYGGPEYETIASFGSLLMNDDLNSIALANQKCNKYGLDTISTGNTIAFAIEATEKGLIETDLEWGNSSEIVKMIDQIAKREGIGDLLAQGIGKAAKEIEADFAVHVKGQEVPMHEPRGKKSLALSYSTSPRGATHLDVVHDSFPEHPQELDIGGSVDRFDLEAKPRFCKIYEDLVSFTNSLIVCAYTGWVALFRGLYSYPRIREMVSATTGLKIGVDEMLKIGERNYNLLKLLATREGITREDDVLPERLKPPLTQGASAEEPIRERDLQERIDEYYKIRGWDERGPTPETLEKLDLSEFKGILK